MLNSRARATKGRSSPDIVGGTRRTRNSTKIRRRSRISTHRQERLQRSQRKLAWSIAAGLVIGTLVGFGIGNPAIGSATGLALGLAVGVIKSA